MELRRLNIIRNKEGFYEITENNIKYEFEFAMMHHLKNYCLQADWKCTIHDWYRDMSMFARKKVKRTEAS